MRDIANLKPVGRERVSAGKRWFVGCLVKHRGHPAIWECGHIHNDKQDAKDCAEAALHSDVGSQMREELQQALDGKQS